MAPYLVSVLKRGSQFICESAGLVDHNNKRFPEEDFKKENGNLHLYNKKPEDYVSPVADFCKKLQDLWEDDPVSPLILDLDDIVSQTHLCLA